VVPSGWAADSSIRKDNESAPPAVQGAAPQQLKSTPAPPPDTSARKRVGKASLRLSREDNDPVGLSHRDSGTLGGNELLRTAEAAL